MKESEASSRDCVQNTRSESNVENDAKQQRTPFPHHDVASAAEPQVSRCVVAESHDNADRAPSTLQSKLNPKMQASSIDRQRHDFKSSAVCTENQRSSVDHVDDRIGVQEAWKNTSAHLFSSSRQTAEGEDHKKSPSLKPTNSNHHEDCDHVRRSPHSGNITLEDSTSSFRRSSTVQEATQSEASQGAELPAVYDHTVTCNHGTQAGENRRLYSPIPEAKLHSNPLDRLRWQVCEGTETLCESGAPQDEHVREASSCKDRESSQQLYEEDYRQVPAAADGVKQKNLQNICDSVKPDARLRFATGDLLSLSETSSCSVLQSNANFGRTHLIRSIRNSFTDASEWPRFARLLQVSQIELKSAGLNVSEATVHRKDFPRFADKLFAEGGRSATQLFPLALFVEAARLQKTEMVNGTTFSYSEKLLEFRDAVLRVYLEVQRSYHDRLCEKLPFPSGSLAPLSDRLRHHIDFLHCWFAFEIRYLYEAEKAALRALKPLTECILTLEALMISEKREALLAPPQEANQRRCTVKYLQAFCSAITRLTKTVLPHNQAEAYHQPELFVVASAIRWKEKTESEAKQKSYATADKKKSTQGKFFGIDYHLHLAFVDVSEEEITFHALNEQAVTASHSLIYRFKQLRDFLWARRKCLDHLDPNLNKDVDTIRVLRQFEVACRQFRRRILRPGNLV